MLLEIVKNDYCDYTGHVLEQYFRQKYREEERVTTVGHYWDRKGNNEIDLIALNDIDRKAVVAEIKRNPDKYNRRLLEEKYKTIQGELGKYREVQLTGLSLNDI